MAKKKVGTSARVEEALSKGYVLSKKASVTCAVCKGTAQVVRKQVRNSESIWGFRSVIICSCGNEAASFFELRKQPEKIEL